MKNLKIKIGDFVSLKGKYFSNGKLAIVIDIQKSEFYGNSGWISMVFVVMNESGMIINISESCVEKVYSIKNV